MNQVMPMSIVVMIIHVVLLDCVMKYFRGVNINQVISHVHCGHDYSCCFSDFCDEYISEE